MEELRTTPFHHFGDALRSAMTAVPTSAVRLLFVALLLVLLVWVIRLPRDRVRPPGDTPGHWSANLKLWAALALGIQALIYLVF